MLIQHKILVAMIVTLLFFGLELGVGIYTASLALISDSFHLFHDFASQLIAYSATMFSLKQKKLDDQETYGWHRASVVGGLINGCCLVAIVFMIVVQSIEKFIEPSHIKDPQLLLIVASLGFLINLITLLVFHHHHDHDHDHHHHEEEETNHDPKAKKHTKNHHIQGMILHIFGDLLGSVAVIIAGIVYMLFPHSKYIIYIDPVLSIIISIILACSTVRVIRTTVSILMQHSPQEVNIRDLRMDLSQYGSIDDLHVWNLADQKIIASVHVFSSRPNIKEIFKKIFHQYGIHSSTIEIVDSLNDRPLLCQVTCIEKNNQCCLTENFTYV